MYAYGIYLLNFSKQIAFPAWVVLQTGCQANNHDFSLLSLSTAYYLSQTQHPQLMIKHDQGGILGNL
jgi:hypothetical protein